MGLCTNSSMKPSLEQNGIQCFRGSRGAKGSWLKPQVTSSSLETWKGVNPRGSEDYGIVPIGG